MSILQGAGMALAAEVGAAVTDLGDSRCGPRAWIVDVCLSVFSCGGSRFEKCYRRVVVEGYPQCLFGDAPVYDCESQRKQLVPMAADPSAAQSSVIATCVVLMAKKQCRWLEGRVRIVVGQFPVFAGLSNAAWHFDAVGTASAQAWCGRSDLLRCVAHRINSAAASGMWAF